MRRSLALGLLLALALAAPCRERPYTLETEEGLLGGEEFFYEDGILVFEGRACLEGKGFRLEAPRILYNEEEGGFQAEGIAGEAQGWRLKALVLKGKTLEGVELQQDRLKAQARRLGLDPLEGEDIRLETPVYRAWAQKARFTEEAAELLDLEATPCPCGEGIRIRAPKARFLAASGEVEGEAWLGVYGLDLPLGETRARLNRPPQLRNPLVYAASETGGTTLGLKDLPLPRPGEYLGEWGRGVTVLGIGLGTPKEALVLGYREDRVYLEGQLGYERGFRMSLHDLHLRLGEAVEPDTPRLEARYAPRFSLENLTLHPFLRYAETPRAQGWTVGGEVGYRLAHREGPFSLSLTPLGLLALYPGTSYEPYAALGLGVEVAYWEGDLGLRGSWTGRLEPLSPTPPFAYEHRDEFQRLVLEGRYRGFSLAYTLDKPLDPKRLDRVDLGYQDPGLGQLGLAWVRGSYEELRLGYAMPLPDRSCCEAFWLAPEVGVGLKGEGLTRWGLTFRYYDGCLAYELKVQNVLKGQHSETQGTSFSFGLSLR